jgi:hypothetical protein
MNHFDPRELAKEPLAAAIAGALIGLRFVPGLTWVQRFVNAASAVGLAAIFGPWLADFFALPPAAQSAMSGAIGLFGLNLATRLWKDLEQTSVLDLLKGYLPGGRGKE